MPEPIPAASFKDKIPAALATVITIGFFGTLFTTLKWGIPEQGHDTVLILIGALSAAWTGVVAFYFGSSSGSESKSKVIADKMNEVKEKP